MSRIGGAEVSELFGKPLTSALHPNYEILRDSKYHEAARALMDRHYADMGDPDGNFVVEFQSRGFHSWLFDQLDLARGPVRQFRESSPVGLRAAVVICKPLGATYTSILSWVLDGSLPVGGYFRKRGLRSLWFHKEDIRALITKVQ